MITAVVGVPPQPHIPGEPRSPRPRAVMLIADPSSRSGAIRARGMLCAARLPRAASSARCWRHDRWLGLQDQGAIGPGADLAAEAAAGLFECCPHPPA